MAQDVTPNPFTTSIRVALAADQVLARVGAIGSATYSTAVALGVLSASNYLFTLPFISKTVYSSQAQVVTTTTISTLHGSYNYTYQVSSVKDSSPVLLKSFTQYEQVVSTNITVWGALNVASSLVPDAVAWTVPVVADSIA